MGNTTQRQTTLTHNWKHVSPNLLRNQLTNQLIEQSTLYFSDPDEQFLSTQLLTKRLRLQHPNIPKLIYFASKSQKYSCSIDGKAYGMVVYTEHSGDNLEEYGKLNPLPLKYGCPCLGVINGAIYLQQGYGYFEVRLDEVFLGLEVNSSQVKAKVWIHPSRTECFPLRKCTQTEMVNSLVKVYNYLQENRFCKELTYNQLRMLESSTTIEEIKRDLTHFHGEGGKKLGRNNRHQKSRSLLVLSEDHNVEKDTKNCSPLKKMQDSRSKPLKSIVRCHTVMHSLPQRVQRVEQISKSPIRFKFIQQKKDIQINPKKPDSTMSTQNTLNLHVNPISNTQYHPFQDTLINIDRINHNKRTIKFNYQNDSSPLQQIASQNKLKKELKRVEEQVTPQKVEFMNRPTRSYTNPVGAHNSYRPQILFQQVYGTFTISQNATNQNSLSSSPFNPQPIKKQPQHQPSMPVIESQANFGSKSKQQLSIDQPQQVKEVNLATTSRSPPKNKEPKSMAAISQGVSQRRITFNQDNNRRKRPESFSDSRGGTNKSKTNKPPSTDKYQKLKKYTQQIKEYQKNIRNWISRSMGNKKVRGLQTRPLQSDRPKEFKEVNSEYNDDDNKNNQISGDEDYRLQTEEYDQTAVFQTHNSGDLKEEKVEIQKMQSKLRVQYYRMKYQQKKIKKIEMQNQKFYEQQRSRQIDEERERQLMQIELQRDRQREQRVREEKREMEMELQRQRRLLEGMNGQSGPINNQSSRQQYRCIRQKVRHKKQIFAQLKAQATKILGDSQY